MVKSSITSRVVRSGNSLTIILTDSDKELFDLSDLGYLTVRRNNSGLELEIGAVHRSSISAGVVGVPKGTPTVEPTETSEPKAKPSLTKSVKTKVKGQKPTKPVKVDKVPAPVLPVKAFKTRKEKPRTEKSIEAERLAKERSLVSRLTRMGLRSDSEVEVDLLSLSPDLQLAIRLPGLLWKEYAVENSLAGYLSVKAGREHEAATPCAKHAERKEKLGAALASLAAGPCLFRRPSYEEEAPEKEEAADEEKVDESPSGSEEEEDGQATVRYSPPKDPISAIPKRFSKENNEGMPYVSASTWKEIVSKPRGSKDKFPPKSDGGRYGGRTNREVGSGRGL